MPAVTPPPAATLTSPHTSTSFSQTHSPTKPKPKQQSQTNWAGTCPLSVARLGKIFFWSPRGAHPPPPEPVHFAFLYSPRHFQTLTHASRRGEPARGSGGDGLATPLIIIKYKEMKEYRGPIGGHCCVLLACPTMLVDQGRGHGMVCARDTLRDRVTITGWCARDTLWDCRTEVHLIWETLLCLACVPHNVGPGS